MPMSEVELNFWKEWVPKLTEKLTLILIKAQEGKDISEDDYELLRVLHNCVYEQGELTLIHPKRSAVSEIVIEGNPFPDIASDNTGGTDVDYTPV